MPEANLSILILILLMMLVGCAPVLIRNYHSQPKDSVTDTLPNGFTKEDARPVLEDAKKVTVKLGSADRRQRHWEQVYKDELIKVHINLYDTWIDGHAMYRQDIGRWTACEPDCNHGEDVTISIRGSNGWKTVFRGVNRNRPSLQIFHPGKWMSYLSTLALQDTGRYTGLNENFRWVDEELDSQFDVAKLTTVVGD